MAEFRGNDIIGEYLLKEKVPYILGYAGHGAIGLLDGIYDRTKQIQVVWPRIEQAAGFMADVYFRLTGVPLPVYTSIILLVPDAGNGQSQTDQARRQGLGR